MSLTKEVLEMLFSYKAGYGKMWKTILGDTRPSYYRKHSIPKEKSIYVALARLKIKGLVRKEKSEWNITAKGKEYLKNKFIKTLPYHSTQSEKNKTAKNVIIIFDIPEEHKNKRNWLRVELKILGFVPIQKSVWLGPSILTEKFIKSLETISILEYCKFFRADELDII